MLLLLSMCVSVESFLCYVFFAKIVGVCIIISYMCLHCDMWVFSIVLYECSALLCMSFQYYCVWVFSVLCMSVQCFDVWVCSVLMYECAVFWCMSVQCFDVWVFSVLMYECSVLLLSCYSWHLRIIWEALQLLMQGGWVSHSWCMGVDSYCYGGWYACRSNSEGLSHVGRCWSTSRVWGEDTDDTQSRRRPGAQLRVGSSQNWSVIQGRP